MSSFFDVIHQSELDVAVVSLDADQGKALQLIAQVAVERPQLPILAVSGARVMATRILAGVAQRGQGILDSTGGFGELLTASAPAVESRRKREHQGTNIAKKQETTIIAVIGSSGGVGCTSLAINLGANLAQIPENNVALIDLDLALGDADVA